MLASGRGLQWAVADESFRIRPYLAMTEKISSRQATIFVSHSASGVERLCNRVILLEHGQIVDVGEPAAMTRKYRRLLDIV